MKKRLVLGLLLCVGLFVLCACRQNPSEEQLFSKLINHFEQRGYTCTLLDAPKCDVPLYKPEVWRELKVGGEEVLVYFDESNRADYLSEPIDESVYGHVSRYGLRFVVVYQGQDEGVIKALDEMPR